MTCTALYEGNHILHKSQKYAYMYKKINYKIVQFVQKKIILEYYLYSGAKPIYTSSRFLLNTCRDCVIV